MHRNAMQIISFIMVLALIFALPVPSARADSSGLCFTAVNDGVLEVSYMPVSVGGRRYIPCSVFEKFGISYTYFPADNAAMLSLGSSMLIFYMSAGEDEDTCFDGNDNPLPLKAVYMYGMAYVPRYTGSYFGLKDTYIEGTGYGDIIRIVDGSQYLTDPDFISSATSRIKQRYNEYYGGRTPATPEPTPSESPEITYSEIYLCFIGIPTDEMLTSLKQSSALAAFFITGDEARENPDMVRRIIGESHTLGAYFPSSPEDDMEDTISAIQEAAFFVPALVTSAQPENTEHRDYAASCGFVYYSPSVKPSADNVGYSAVTAQLPRTNANTDIAIFSGSAAQQMLPSVLNHLYTSGYSVMPLLETSV